MLIKHLDPAQYRVHMFCLKETPWSKTARVDFPMRVLNIHKLVTPDIFSKIIAFRRYCRQHHIDIIQTYFNDALILGALAGRFSGVKKIIASRRNLGPGFWKRRDLLLAFRAMRPLVTRYMANSQATRDSIVYHEKIDPGKIDIIYNGLDLCRFQSITPKMRAAQRHGLGLDDSNVLIGMVAHLRKEKNVQLFVDAAARLIKQYPRVRFLILGDGADRENIESQIARMGVGNIFKLTGSIMDIVPFLAAMDIGCLTSNGESFSNSIIEYQAAGLPVVATAVGGNIEAAASDEFLFSPGDLDGLVSLLSRLIENESLRRDAGRTGRRLAESRYSVENMVAGHEELYRRCLGY
jgi:glycosyltransferase involved in cell wall biosynthesis